MLRCLIMAAAALVAAASGAMAETPAIAQTPIERGSYLVSAVMACDGCHTPRPGGVFDMTKRFSGGSQVWDEAAYTVRGSNITPDRETGIGSWSEADLKRFLTEGVRPSGVHVAPQMPFVFYKVLTARDLDAVVAFVRSVAPQRKEVPPPVYKAAMHYETISGADKPFTDEALGDPVKRGFYLATIAHCMECHARHPGGTPGYKDSFGKGGHLMTGPWGQAVAVNITSHPTKGIGKWTDAEIKRVLREGIGRDGRILKQPMARQIYFSKMTDDDVDAIVAWVRTIPPLE
jgi:mono/diheme cytochrome c family protein